MERNVGSEKFQPYMVASFTKIQLRSVEAWVRNNVCLTEGSNNLLAFSIALRVAEVDEKGKVMDDKSRKRIKYGMLVISELHRKEQDIDRVQGPIAVWKMTRDGDDIEVRYNHIKGLKRY